MSTQTGSEPSTATQAKEQLATAKESAQEKAQEWGTRAQDNIRSQVNDRSTQAGEQVGSSAEALRSASQDLSQKGQDAPARVLQALAGRTERLGEYLRSADYDRMLRDAEQYARTNPWGVVAGGIVAGALASRFLKASSSRRQASPTSVGQQGNGAAGTGGGGRPAMSGPGTPMESAPSSTPQATPSGGPGAGTADPTDR
jgi:hypothetical protein